MENYQLKDVLYLAPEERVINYKWEKDSDKLSQNLAVMSITDIRDMEEHGMKFKTKVSLCEGMTLVKHPYIANCYMDVNLAEDTLFKDKLNCIGRVAKLLGVKEFTAKATFLEAKTRELDIQGNVHYKVVVDADATYKKSEEEKYAKTYRRYETFPGEFTKKDYEEAKKLVSQYKLDDLEYILDQRNPDANNILGKQEVRIELSKELNSMTECAFSLNVLKGVFTLNASTKETISTQKKVILETKLFF
uniref:Uncharacterized protein n=1 Tax=Prevotella sp. GTC17253 TaxID=3236793 RepID=A0AB33IML0_9BACT